MLFRSQPLIPRPSRNSRLALLLHEGQRAVKQALKSLVPRPLLSESSGKSHRNSNLTARGAGAIEEHVETQQALTLPPQCRVLALNYLNYSTLHSLAH